MRNSFAKSLTKLSKRNKKLFYVLETLVINSLDDFKRLNKDRFFNCGVAEANMTGIAAGLAKEGLGQLHTQLLHLIHSGVWNK